MGVLSIMLLKRWIGHLWQCPEDVSAVGIYYFRRKCKAPGRNGHNAIFFFHLTNCSFLFQGMDYNTFMLSCRILKCTEILFPSLGPHVSVPFRAPIFPFFQFRQTSCPQPRGPVTISLYSLKRRLLDQSLPLHLLVNSLMEYGPFSY